jgi:hypothetical protein
VKEFDEYSDDEPRIEEHGICIKDSEKHSLTTEERDEIIRKYNDEYSDRLENFQTRFGPFNLESKTNRGVSIIGIGNQNERNPETLRDEESSEEYTEQIEVKEILESLIFNETPESNLSKELDKNGNTVSVITKYYDETAFCEIIRPELQKWDGLTDAQLLSKIRNLEQNERTELHKVFNERVNDNVLLDSLFELTSLGADRAKISIKTPLGTEILPEKEVQQLDKFSKGFRSMLLKKIESSQWKNISKKSEPIVPELLLETMSRSVQYMKGHLATGKVLSLSEHLDLIRQQNRIIPKAEKIAEALVELQRDIRYSNGTTVKKDQRFTEMDQLSSSRILNEVQYLMGSVWIQYQGGTSGSQDYVILTASIPQDEASANSNLNIAIGTKVNGKVEMIGDKPNSKLIRKGAFAKPDEILGVSDISYVKFKLYGNGSYKITDGGYVQKDYIRFASKFKTAVDAIVESNKAVLDGAWSDGTPWNLNQHEIFTSLFRGSKGNFQSHLWLGVQPFAEVLLGADFKLPTSKFFNTLLHGVPKDLLNSWSTSSGPLPESELYDTMRNSLNLRNYIGKFGLTNELIRPPTIPEALVLLSAEYAEGSKDIWKMDPVIPDFRRIYPDGYWTRSSGETVQRLGDFGTDFKWSEQTMWKWILEEYMGYRSHLQGKASFASKVMAEPYIDWVFKRIRDQHLPFMEHDTIRLLTMIRDDLRTASILPSKSILGPSVASAESAATVVSYNPNPLDANTIPIPRFRVFDHITEISRSDIPNISNLRFIESVSNPYFGPSRGEKYEHRAVWVEGNSISYRGPVAVKITANKPSRKYTIVGPEAIPLDFLLRWEEVLSEIKDTHVKNQLEKRLHKIRMLGLAYAMDPITQKNEMKKLSMRSQTIIDFGSEYLNEEFRKINKEYWNRSESESRSFDQIAGMIGWESQKIIEELIQAGINLTEFYDFERLDQILRAITEAKGVFPSKQWGFASNALQAEEQGFKKSGFHVMQQIGIGGLNPEEMTSFTLTGITPENIMSAFASLLSIEVLTEGSGETLGTFYASNFFKRHARFDNILTDGTGKLMINEQKVSISRTSQDTLTQPIEQGIDRTFLVKYDGYDSNYWQAFPSRAEVVTPDGIPRRVILTSLAESLRSIYWAETILSIHPDSTIPSEHKQKAGKIRKTAPRLFSGRLLTDFVTGLDIIDTETSFNNGEIEKAGFNSREALLSIIELNNERLRAHISHFSKPILDPQ